MTTKKADYIWFNGEMVRWEDAKVHVMSHALHYGTSVFEGIRCYDSHKGPVVFRHREHMQRLHDSAKIYRFPVSQSIDELMEACRDVIRKNNLTSAYIRPLIFVGDVGMGVNPPAGYSTDVIIAAFPWVKTPFTTIWYNGMNARGDSMFHPNWEWIFIRCLINVWDFM